MKLYMKAESKMPEPGATRTLRKFAWTPQIIANTIIWLESYEILQAFIYFEYRILLEGKPQTAQVGEWRDLESRLIA